MLRNAQLRREVRRLPLPRNGGESPSHLNWCSFSKCKVTTLKYSAVFAQTLNIANFCIDSVVAQPQNQPIPDIADPTAHREKLTPAERERRMKAAIDEYKARPGVSVRYLATKYELPWTSVNRELEKHHFKTPELNELAKERARGLSFPREIEVMLLDYIKTMSEIGFALTWQDVRNVAKDLAVELHITGFKASKGWLRRFKKRHPDLRRCMCEHFDSLRGMGMNEEMVSKYFKLLGDARARVEELSGGVPLTPDRVHNADESGFDRSLENTWGIFPVGSKIKRAITPVSSFHISMVASISAAGPHEPYYIMPAKRRPQVGDGRLDVDGRLKGVRGEAEFGTVESGFLTKELWQDHVVPFLCRQFKSSVSTTDPDDRLWHLLVLDGVQSHTMSPKAMRIFWQNHIYVVKMPAHTSADLQPLDIAVFRSVKGEYRAGLRRLIRDIAGNGVLSPWDIVSKIDQAWWTGATDSNIKAGFRSCGLEPFDPDWVGKHRELFMTSTVFKAPPISQPASDACSTSSAEVCSLDEDSDEAIADAPAEEPLPESDDGGPMREAVRLMKANKMPDQLSSIQTNKELMEQVSTSVAAVLKVPHTDAEEIVELSLSLSAAIMRHFHYPMKQQAVVEHVKAKRTNTIGEVGSAPVVLNSPSRVRRLELAEEDAARLEQGREARQETRLQKFLDERPLALQLREAGVISWSPNDRESVDSRRLATKADLAQYIRSQYLVENFRRSGGTGISKASRDEMAKFLSEHLGVQPASHAHSVAATMGRPQHGSHELEDVVASLASDVRDSTQHDDTIEGGYDDEGGSTFSMDEEQRSKAVTQPGPQKRRVRSANDEDVEIHLDAPALVDDAEHRRPKRQRSSKQCTTDPSTCWVIDLV